jgi:hypothetical protein
MCGERDGAVPAVMSRSSRQGILGSKPFFLQPINCSQSAVDGVNRGEDDVDVLQSIFGDETLPVNEVLSGKREAISADVGRQNKQAPNHDMTELDS